MINWLIGLLASPFVDKVLKHLENKANSETERERLRTHVQIEVIKSAVEEQKTLSALNRAKFDYWPYWVFTSLFILPLGLWWAGVLLDSTFKFGWGVANLPQTYIREWAGEMIKWLFYTGTGAIAVKTILGR